MVNIEKLLEKVSDEALCGEDLEYDSALQVLESTAATKSVQEFGDTTIPAEEPNWNKVQELAVEMLLRTKDLRIASTYFVHALINTEGFLGCAQGLSLISGYLEKYWDTVHPQLDPDDDLDPIIRINAINALSDSQTIIQSLRRSPLVCTQGVGSFGLRDIDIASGKVALPKGEEGTPPTQAFIDGAFMGGDLDALQKNAVAVSDSLALIKQIRKRLMDLVGAESAPQLKELSSELTHAQSVLEKELSRRGITEEQKGESEGNNESDAQATQVEAKVSLTGEVNSRTDVVQVLDKICDYYIRHEPSSPVPLLLQRVKRLVPMDFMELVNDLASDGAAQAKKIMGVDDKKK